MKKKMFLFLAAVILSGLFAGCGNKDQQSKNASANNADETLKITLMTKSFNGGGWPDDHPIIKELNKKLNIDLKVQWVPSSDYLEKVNVLAASNDFPDAFFTDEIIFNKWRDKNLFTDLKPYLKDYPNLTKYISEDAYKVMNPKDKIYGIPYYNIETRDNLVVRKDWLEKLHLKAPATIDEFYNVAKAFAANDPDGNGQADTIGFTFLVDPKSGNINDLDFLQGAFGIANEFAVQNGKLIAKQEQAAEWKELASFLRKAYAEGVLDKDFAVQKAGDINKSATNKLGIGYSNPFELEQNTLLPLRKLVPDAEFVPFDPPKGPKGQATKTFAITSKVVINDKIEPKKKQRILKLFDYLLSDEGNILAKNGIEGVHYKKLSDGKYEKLDAFDSDRPQLLSTWLLRRFDPNIQIRLWDDQKKADDIVNKISNNEKFKQPNAAAGLYSETKAKLGTNLNVKFAETFVKVVVGKEPIEAIGKASADWKANGGDQIVKELNEEYAKLK